MEVDFSHVSFMYHVSFKSDALQLLLLDWDVLVARGHVQLVKVRQLTRNLWYSISYLLEPILILQDKSCTC